MNKLFVPTANSALFALLLGLGITGQVSAAKLEFPEKMFESVHPGQEVGNLRVFLQLTGYRKALRIAETELLNSDISQRSPTELMGEIEKIVHAMIHLTLAEEVPSDALDRALSRLTHKDLGTSWASTLNRLNCHIDPEADFRLFHKSVRADLAFFNTLLRVPEDIDFAALYRAAKSSKSLYDGVSDKLTQAPYRGMVSFAKLQYCLLQSLTEKLKPGDIYREFSGVIFAPEYSNVRHGEREKLLKTRLKDRYSAFEKVVARAARGETKVDELREFQDIFTALSRPSLINDGMKAYLMRLIADMASPNVHVFQLAAYAHQKLIQIHPFIDGNGRTARLMMNIVLMQKGARAIIIDNDKEYTQAIEDDFSGRVPFSRYIERKSTVGVSREEL